MDKQQVESLKGFIERARKDRAWEETNLPIYRSMLGRDLFFYIAAMYLSGRQLSLKEIYLDMPYSENAVRLHLRRLGRDGWIEIPRIGQDKRLRQIELGSRLIAALDKYFTRMLKDRDRLRNPVA